MSQSYKQMEEAVARKVRETMELAEARKKALTPEEDNRQIENAPRKTFEVGTEELERIDASIRIIEDIANKLTETHSAMGINVLNTGKAATAKRRFLTEDIRNLAGHQKTKLPADINAFPLGFEHIRGNDQRQLRQSGQSTGDNFQGAPYVAAAANQLYPVDDADKRQLAEGALSLAQSGAWNITHEGHADKRQLAEGALNLAQSAAWNTDNVHEGDKRELPMGELNLALAEGALSLAQNAARNINDRANQADDAENAAYVNWNIDDKFQEADVNKRHLAEGALILAQSGAWNTANEPYGTNVVDKRQLAEGALNMAQNAAWNIDKVYESDLQNASRDFLEVNRRELAEGALNLAQQSAKSIGSEPDNVGKAKPRQLSKKANSLDGSFVSTFAPRNQEKPQLGFDHVMAFKETIEQDKELKWVLDDVNRKLLAEHDKKIVSAAKADVKKVSKDLQNIEIDIDNNNYDTEQVDESNIRELAEGALGLAQAGAKSIDENVIGSVEIRELGEGALSLAQNAAKRKVLQNVGSFEDASLKNMTDQQKQTRLGFEPVENTADSELEEAERADNISFHSKTNK